MEQFTNAALAANYLREIWNERAFEKIDNYLHPDFIDHSLPPGMPKTKAGTLQWITGTGKAFEHSTEIAAQVTEGDAAMLKINMRLKHIGTWRNLPATGVELTTSGYRYFQFKEGKIVAHWALLNAETIENTIRKNLTDIKSNSHGCEIPQ